MRDKAARWKNQLPIAISALSQVGPGRDGQAEASAIGFAMRFFSCDDREVVIFPGDWIRNRKASGDAVQLSAPHAAIRNGVQAALKPLELRLANPIGLRKPDGICRKTQKRIKDWQSQFWWF